MTHTAFRSIEEGIYYIPRLSVEFEFRTGWEFDLDFIWDFKAVGSNQIPHICLVSIFQNNSDTVGHSSPLGNQIYHLHQDTHWYDFAKETIFSWFINGRIDSKTKCFYYWFLYKWHIFFREQAFCVWYVNPCLIVASCITILPSSDGICAFLTKKLWAHNPIESLYTFLEWDLIASQPDF